LTALADTVREIPHCRQG